MKNELIKIGNKSKKAFSFELNSKKKNKVLKDYCRSEEHTSELPVTDVSRMPSSA